MEYRTLPRGGERIGVVGMGAAAIGRLSEDGIVEAVRYALDRGVNYFDLAGGRASIFPAYGRALEGRRAQALLQLHFGADYASGTYGWTTDLEAIRRSVDWQLSELRTDYIDFGFIHCLDEAEDVEAYERGGALKYLLDLRSQGVVRHIGLSSHNPAAVHRVLDLGIVDMLMFSINPMYDYGQGEFANGSAGERYALYRRCEREGVGISVMKPFGGGLLLDAKRSPLGAALTEAQCIQYALDKPGVLTVLPGAGDAAQLERNLAYLDSTRAERDYSIVGRLTPAGAENQCVYCNHCAPCPAGLDVGLINKYYDLARSGDSLAAGHYRALSRTAADCAGCGHCNDRCPFHVDQAARMREIDRYFRGAAGR